MMKPYPLQKIVCLIKDSQECGISPKMDWYSSELLERVLKDADSHLNQKRFELLHLLLLHFIIGYKRTLMERFTFLVLVS